MENIYLLVIAAVEKKQIQTLARKFTEWQGRRGVGTSSAKG